MVSRLAKLTRNRVLLLGFLALVGYSTSAFAVQDCFEVGEKVKRLSTEDGLVEIRNAIRQHLRLLKKEGQSYEGQFDIACLIGHYMTRGNSGNGTVSPEEIVARYNKIERWFS